VSDRTHLIRTAIATATGLDAEDCARTAGRDDMATYLPWMPFSWPDFIALVAEALPDTPGDRFLEVGAGVGAKMVLAETVFGLDVEGVERVPEYVKTARERGLTMYEADALGWEGYGDYDLVYFNRTFANQDLERELEAYVYDRIKPGAVLIAVNVIAPPAGWFLILDDGEVRRWIMQKP